MLYQVFKPNAGSTEPIMRGLSYATLALATTAANTLTRDAEIRVEFRTGGMSCTVLVLPKV